LSPKIETAWAMKLNQEQNRGGTGRNKQKLSIIRIILNLKVNIYITCISLLNKITALTMVRSCISQFCRIPDLF